MDTPQNRRSKKKSSKAPISFPLYDSLVTDNNVEDVDIRVLVNGILTLTPEQEEIMFWIIYHYYELQEGKGPSLNIYGMKSTKQGIEVDLDRLPEELLTILHKYIYT